jgi:hypothetical protein
VFEAELSHLPGATADIACDDYDNIGECGYQRSEAERKRAEAWLAWEDAMESARLRLVEHHRVTWLDRQLAAAARAGAAQSFVQATRQSVALSDDDRAWLDWIEDHVKDIEPLLQPLAPAEPPEPTSQNLAPFLGKCQSVWSELVLASPSWAGTCERSYIGRGGRAWPSRCRSWTGRSKRSGGQDAVDDRPVDRAVLGELEQLRRHLPSG